MPRTLSLAAVLSVALTAPVSAATTCSKLSGHKVLATPAIKIVYTARTKKESGGGKLAGRTYLGCTRPSGPVRKLYSGYTEFLGGAPVSFANIGFLKNAGHYVYERIFEGGNQGGIQSFRVADVSTGKSYLVAAHSDNDGHGMPVPAHPLLNDQGQFAAAFPNDGTYGVDTPAEGTVEVDGYTADGRRHVLDSAALGVIEPAFLSL
ncbi:MAG TPA: hypothetical protein VIL64_02925, partial [Solirubrobacteraceae bacterium]